MIRNYCIFFASVSVLFSSFAKSDELKKQKVKIEISDSVLKTLSENQKQDLLKIASVFEDRLFTWVEVPIELPETIFDLSKGQIITLNDAFKVPTSNEVQRIGTERRKLNDDQLKQVREEGMFVVPSEEYAGQNHVWKISFVFQAGSKNIELFLDHQKTRALNQIVVKFPERIFGDNVLSIKRGLKNFKRGIIEAAGLFVGLTESYAKYSEEEVDDFIQSERKKYQINENTKASQENLSSSLDLRLFDDNLMEKIIYVMSSIEGQVYHDWKIQEDLIKVRIKNELKQAGVSDSNLAQELVDRMLTEKQNYLYSKIEQNEELEKLSPGISSLIINHGKAMKIVFDAEQSFNKEIEDYSAKVMQEIKAQNPRLSKIDQWLNQQVTEKTKAYYSTRVWQFYEALPQELLKENLNQEATLLARELNFIKQNEPLLREQVKSVKEAEKSFNFTSKIWRKSKWEVKKFTNNFGETSYSIDRTKQYVVKTDSIFWRIKNAWYRAKTRTNNWLYSLIVQNIWNGPLGIKALVGNEAFSKNWNVNSITGNLVAHEEQQTLISKIKKLWKKRSDIQREHDLSNDFGLFGKSLERVGLFFTNDIGRGFIAPALIAVLQPVFTAANVLVSGSLAGAALVAAPATSILQSGLYATLYDGDGVGSKSIKARLFPLFSRLIGRSIILGGGETIGSVVGLLVHPTAAAAHIGLGYAGASTRRTLDSVVYQAIKKWGRVPGRDTRLIARRVSGPGLAAEYFFQIDQDLVLIGLRAQLENDELYRYQKTMGEIIKEPVDAYQEITKVLGALTGTDFHGINNPSNKQILEQQTQVTKNLNDAVYERANKYNQLLNIPQKGEIKLTSDQFEETLKKSAVLVEQFYTKVFAESNLSKDEVLSLWKSWDLHENDWIGLAKSRLTKVFGREILLPLETTDTTLKIVVKVPNLEDYTKGLNSGIFSDNLDAISLEGSLNLSEVSKANPRVPYFSAYKLCQTALIKKKI